MGNSLGKLFVVTSFGESHGSCIGVVVDGCPAGLPLTAAEIQKEVDRRRPAAAAGGTARREKDTVEVLAGVFNGKTTGAPLCLLTSNRDSDSSAYGQVRSVPRPGHADYTAWLKYGGYNDFRGGGRFSGRITAGFVMAGAVAGKLLKACGMEVLAHTVQIGDIKAALQTPAQIKKNVDKNPVKCADPAAATRMLKLIEKIRKGGDSSGGVIEVMALNVPAGLGGPVFDTLEGDLAKAFFAIPAVKGVEFGSGFASATMKGSQHNDIFMLKNGKVVTLTNNAGGIAGGISNGMPILARIAIKPTPSISVKQRSVDLKAGKNVDLSIRGRHDSCIVPRAVPVAEAMMKITLCDFALRSGLIKEVLK
ncbi:MAG: chorismate synthase [Dehalococcoidia bacterium]|jgi:chorismate synthase